MRLGQGARFRLQQSATAQGNDGVSFRGVPDEGSERLVLQKPKGRFAFGSENVRDAESASILNLRIEVVERQVESAGEAFCQGAFARAGGAVDEKVHRYPMESNVWRRSTQKSGDF